MSLVEIDGSFGEGGGQILRTSLALSLITRTPFRIFNIRRSRSKPGLRRQHLTAVRAAARIGSAKVGGDALNSSDLTFRPGAVTGGHYEFDVGSAGSTTLVFQTVFPALLQASEPSLLRFTGGTHNHGGPPWDFLDRVFLPVLRTMGAHVDIHLERHGFAPGGEGRWSATIEPCRLRPLSMPARGQLQSRIARALVANLPENIAERELATIRKHLDWPASDMRAEVVEATGPGNIVMISAEFEHLTELATGFGQRGVPAEKVALHAAQGWKSYEQSAAATGEHLADQLLLPLALADGGAFTTVQPTLHTTTNAEVIRRFLPVEFAISQTTPGVWTVAL
jgi:RNA 3'-terminal phosphate cyclase (ATP)